MIKIFLNLSLTCIIACNCVLAQNNNTAFYDACAAGNYQQASMIIEQGLDYSKPLGDSMSSPLFATCFMIAYPSDGVFTLQGMPEATDYDIEQRINSNFELLLQATKKGFNVFKPVTAVAHVNSVFMRDDWYGNMELYDTLVEASFGILPFELIVAHNRLAEFESAIIANIQAGRCTGADTAGNTALHYAAASGASFAIVEALLKNGASVKKRNNNELSALHVIANPYETGFFAETALKPDPRVAVSLIEAGANVMQSTNGVIPLFIFQIMAAIEGIEVPVSIMPPFSRNDLFKILHAATAQGFNIFNNFEFRYINTLEFSIEDEFVEVVESEAVVTFLPCYLIAKHNKMIDFEELIVANILRGQYTDTDSLGNTALHYAVAVGASPKIILALVTAGADCNAVNLMGHTPLSGIYCPGCIQYNIDYQAEANPAVAKILIEQGAKIDFISSKNNLPFAAILFNSITKDFDGLPSLYNNSHDTLFSVLATAVKHGYDVFAPLRFEIPEIYAYVRTNIYGEDVIYDSLVFVAAEFIPLEAIYSYGNTQVFDALILANIKNGIYCRFDKETGNSALHYACLTGASLSIVDALVKKKHDINHRNEMGYTALHFAAASQGSINTVKKLIKAKADPNIKDNDGKLPIDIARQFENNEVVLYLEKIMK